MMTKEFIINKIEKACPTSYKFKQVVYNDNKKTIFLDFFIKYDDNEFSVSAGTINHVQLGNCLHNNLLTIRFESIEKIINSKSYTSCTNNLNKIFPNTINDNLKLDKPIIFETESDVDKGISYVRNYIEEFAEDYFAYWNDIRAFLPFLESKNVRFLNDLLVGKGENRKLIIWKLCNHPKYESFLKETIKSYEDYLEENPKDKSEVKAYKEFNRLVDRLEKVKPIYNWDSSYLRPKPFKGVLPIIS
ncbi:hypothetical protein [Algibacter sp. L3A6]|uniref:hypothetical protein n=1 Tax=Algibacter sp. L3A6 TaxID=2686366 RepID=UPI00131DC5B1|nr:hypothetical protein [Algibacter sp. L3A6]